MGISMLGNSVSLAVVRNVSVVQREAANQIDQLSSGQRINSASKDSASLGIGEKLRATIRSTSQAMRNANDGISLAQIVDGTLEEIGTIARRVNELIVQSANGTINSSDRGMLDKEFQGLAKEADALGRRTQFNDITFFDSVSTPPQLQIGKDTADVLQMPLFLQSSLEGLFEGIHFDDQATSQASLDIIRQRIDDIASMRSEIGIFKNTLQTAISNLSTSMETNSAANSRLRDADIAQSTANLTKNQILSQSGAAMLTQASNLPQIALTLMQKLGS